MHDHTSHSHSTGHSHGTGYMEGPAVGPTILMVGAILLILLLAFAFVWTPWAANDTAPGQGGSDEPQQQEQLPRAPEQQIVPQVPSQPGQQQPGTQ
jgi:hypothetical protein